MTIKRERQLARTHIAAELTRIAMRLQRAPADQIGELLQRADRCLHNYKMARIIESQKPSGTFKDDVSDEPTMQALADVIRENVKPHLFALLVFTKETDADGLTNYVSNANRDDICVAMAQFIAANEERLIPGPSTVQ